MDRLLSKEVSLQVLAVLLAVVLWVQATAVQNPVDRTTVDGILVLAVDVPEGAVVTGSLRPSKVNVTVRCRRRVAERLTAASFTARVSLEGGNFGAYDYPVEVEVPSGIELVQISPASVTVTLERVASAEVPVTARLVGSSPEGFAPGEPVVSPAVVTVKGPASVVSRVRQALVELDISQAAADFQGQAFPVALDATSTVLGGLVFVPSQITVSVPVVALPAAESVDVAPVLVGIPAAGYAVIGFSSNPDRADVRPKPGYVVDFDRLLTEPVDISGSTSDVHAVVRLVVPASAHSVRPAEVEVTVRIGASRAFSDVPVEVRNVGAGLRASVDPAVIDLVVRGPKSLLDQLGQQDIVAWVDAAGRGAGSSPARVTVDLPAWTEGRLEVVIPDSAEVTLILGY